MKKKVRLKKIKTEKVVDIGKYELEKNTYKKADDGKIKVRMKPPIRIKLK